MWKIILTDINIKQTMIVLPLVNTNTKNAVFQNWIQVIQVPIMSLFGILLQHKGIKLKLKSKHIQGRL